MDDQCSIPDVYFTYLHTTSHEHGVKGRIWEVEGFVFARCMSGSALNRGTLHHRRLCLFERTWLATSAWHDTNACQVFVLVESTIPRDVFWNIGKIYTYDHR